ncbi:hypothetical protein B296_00022581 [Ensete ventricosum]|uniref:Secreted protein n=1 Tax=Ensete ventricosum TaxID=4639 RepID=A0A427AUA7_ENSVE|nr:hypothetical protein B296_00022581 [Ensete ventricosum]
MFNSFLLWLRLLEYQSCIRTCNFQVHLSMKGFMCRRSVAAHPWCDLEKGTCYAYRRFHAMIFNCVRSLPFIEYKKNENKLLRVTSCLRLQLIKPLHVSSSHVSYFF